MRILYHHRTASKDGQAVHIEEMIEALREQYPHWPSEILASVDGHQIALMQGESWIAPYYP